MHQRIFKQSRKLLPLPFDLPAQIGRESDHALLRQRALNQRVDVPPSIPQLSDAARLVAEVVQEAHDRGGQDVAGGVWVGGGGVDAKDLCGGEVAGGVRRGGEFED